MKIVLTNLKNHITLIAVCLSILINPAPTVAQELDTDPLDSIAAIVNDDVIMTSELKTKTATEAARQNQLNGVVPLEQQLQQQVLEQLIEEMLQIQQAQRLSVSISETMLNNAINQIAKNNQLTLPQLHQQITNSGDTIANFRKHVRRYLTIEEIRKVALKRRIRISDKEIDKFLASPKGQALASTQYNLSHIFIALPKGSDQTTIDGAERRLQALLDEIDAGTNFGILAQKYSNASHADKGGLLGWREPAKLPPLFAQTLTSLQAGDVSLPIQNDKGIHLLKVNQVQGTSTLVSEQTNAKHILVVTNELRNGNATKALVDNIYQRLKQGMNFAQLAGSFSDDQNTALKGGDMGWLNPGTLPEFMQQQLDQLAVGEFSKPFQGPNGWHILLATDRQTKNVGEAVVRNQARDSLYQSKFADELETWLRELRNQAYIEIR